jgi:nicotinamidase-related amidase
MNVRNVPDQQGIIVGKPALIVIDYQNDFLDPGSPIECVGAVQALRNSIPVIEKAREIGIPVIFTQEYHRDPKYFGLKDLGREADGEDPLHTVIGTRGFELSDMLLPLMKTDYVLHKPRYSCFFATDLDLILRSHKVDTLIITGVCTNICVHYTFIDAHQKDYWVRIPEDCVAAPNEKAHEAALRQMKYLQAESIQNADSILLALEDYDREKNQVEGR